MVIEVALVAGSFLYLAYFESRTVLSGNSINIAGKNRFLTVRMVLEAEGYLSGNQEKGAVCAALQDLELNILVLKQGSATAGFEVDPLDPQLAGDWQAVYDRWLDLKSRAETVISANPPS